LVGFSQYDGTNAGLLPNPTALSDAAATSLGMKVYVGDGTTYNGGNAATITFSSSAGSISYDYSSLIPYQMQDGTWRLKGNIGGTGSATNRTYGSATVAGITSIAESQAISASVSDVAGTMQVAYITASSNTFTLYHAAAGSGDQYQWSFDIALASKPTWAY